MKIQDAVLAYERLIEFKKNHCRLLIRKAKHMENKVCRLHKKLSELREVKSQLEQQAVEWEQKCCSLRYVILLIRKYLNYMMFSKSYLFIWERLYERHDCLVNSSNTCKGLGQDKGQCQHLSVLSEWWAACITWIISTHVLNVHWQEAGIEPGHSCKGHRYLNC